MSEFWSWAAESPWLAFFLMLFTMWSVFGTVRCLLKRLLRVLNIRKHGWPPSHLDADGDWRPSDG